ncbi:MAG: hypothetical protein QOF49_1081 [Chloroflexota bacterium]|nr:hypothetical protein [Chloroflexota bacterium]
MGPRGSASSVKVPPRTLRPHCTAGASDGRCRSEQRGRDQEAEGHEETGGDAQAESTPGAHVDRSEPLAIRVVVVTVSRGVIGRDVGELVRARFVRRVGLAHAGEGTSAGILAPDRRRRT